jgi:4-hydroxyphenylpyruvate dioxygenase
VENGGVSIREPYELSDENGQVVMATVATYGSVHHTFVERKNYKGAFLPGFSYASKSEPLNSFLYVSSSVRKNVV